MEDTQENDRELELEEGERGSGRRHRSKDRSRRESRDERDHRSRRKEESDRKERRKGEGREEKERGKDREEERERERGKREKERGREKEREREKYRDREKEKDRTKDREKDKARERDRNRELDTEIRNSLEQTKTFEASEDARKDHEHNQESKHRVTSEIEERIAKMKEERLKKSAGDSEILSWVSKSRKLEEDRVLAREKAVRLMKALEEQDNFDLGSEEEGEEPAQHSLKHLGGAKILHGLDKVLEGGTVVLTLKDQDILANGDVNEDVEMLENVEIGEQMRRNAAYKAAKKGAGVYDDKFSEEALSEKTILSKYDEPAEDEGITLDESGQFSGEAEKKLEELRRRIQGNTVARAYEDLNSAGRNSSDYFTTEEMLQFKKPKKKKSLRKKEKLDLEALEAEAKSTGLGANDLGSREDQTRLETKLEREREEVRLRTEAYESALAKAHEASLALSRTETVTVVTAQKEEEEVVFGEDYEELQRSLGRARKLALSRQEEEASAAGPSAVARQIRAKSVEVKSEVSGEAQENKVVITEMEEFVLGLQLNEDTNKPEAEDVFMDEEEEDEPHVRKAEAVRSESKEVHADTSTSKEEDNDDVSEKVNHNDVIHEVVVGKGLSGALKLLQDRGALKESVEWGGRTMDKKKSKLVGILDNEGTKEIRIERTDEFGRIMTPKEAFRMLSHKFHGKGPGKAKLEKRMKQYQEDLKLKQMKASDTPSMSVERMREAQARLKTPYLVLSGNVKPGQTSDPRSGFATVEKDTLGSLTPMLGDRKVEHFLGIKRKEDFGGEGQLPSKKSKS